MGANVSADKGGSRSAKRCKRQGGLAEARSKLTKEACQTFRQMLTGWSARDLHCLLVEFQASLALRELTAMADLSRPAAANLRQDLAGLYRQSICWDVCLEFGDHLFHLHHCVVRCRSAWLHALLARHGWPTRTPVPLRLAGMDVSVRLLDAFFLFLYTGTVDDEQVGSNADHEQLLAVQRVFGVSKDWSADMAALCRGAQEEGDVEVLFTGGCAEQALQQASECRQDGWQDVEDEPLSKWRVHAAVLAARSPFFRALIEKRRKCTDVGSRLTVHLDEYVIPRQYAPVIFKAMYRDIIDLSLIKQGQRSCAGQSSLNELVKAIASGTCLRSPLEEATEMYQIGRFLDFPMLIQGCEDAIASRIDFDTLHALYSWSSEGYGSDYVRRCCVAFLAEHFGHIATCCPDFLQLDESLLIDALKLDFVQATELEILTAVLKWGEHQLIRRVEEREPNVIAGTTHSISRKGLKRSAETDAQLGHILRNLLPLIRVDYIVPRNHPIFVDALMRSLVNLDGNQEKTSAMTVCGRSWGWRPRVYLPFYAMTKKAFAKRIAANPDDAIWLIDHRPPIHEHIFSSAVSGVDLLRSCSSHPVATSSSNDDDLMEVLCTDGTAQRAISCGCSYHFRAAVDQIRLRRMRQRPLDEVEVSLWPPAESNGTSARGRCCSGSGGPDLTRLQNSK